MTKLALFAANCPNLSGEYETWSQALYKVTQKDCSKIEISYRSDFRQPEVKTTFLMDGRRHQQVYGYVYSYWSGERLGDNAVWALKKTSEGLGIEQKIIRPEDGSVTSEEFLLKKK